MSMKVSGSFKVTAITIVILVTISFYYSSQLCQVRSETYKVKVIPWSSYKCRLAFLQLKYILALTCSYLKHRHLIPQDCFHKTLFIILNKRKPSKTVAWQLSTQIGVQRNNVTWDFHNKFWCFSETNCFMEGKLSHRVKCVPFHFLVSFPYVNTGTSPVSVNIHHRKYLNGSITQLLTSYLADMIHIRVNIGYSKAKDVDLAWVAFNLWAWLR